MSDKRDRFWADLPDGLRSDADRLEHRLVSLMGQIARMEEPKRALLESPQFMVVVSPLHNMAYGKLATSTRCPRALPIGEAWLAHQTILAILRHGLFPRPLHARNLGRVPKAGSHCERLPRAVARDRKRSNQTW
jgi:hypothetical protein